MTAAVPDQMPTLPDLRRAASSLFELEEPLHCRGMHGTRAGIEVAGRPRLRIEMPVIVAATHQSGGHPHIVDQAAMRRDVADADADAALVRAVRFGRMHDVGMVQRNLPGLSGIITDCV